MKVGLEAEEGGIYRVAFTIISKHHTTDLKANNVIILLVTSYKGRFHNEAVQQQPESKTCMSSMENLHWLRMITIRIIFRLKIFYL